MAASNTSISSRLFFQCFQYCLGLYAYALFNSGLSVSNKDYNNNNACFYNYSGNNPNIYILN